MNRADSEKRVAEVVGLVLGRPVRPGEALDKAHEPLWDSMRHIELIMTLEQELGVSFAPEDIPALTSLALITAKVRELC